MKGIRRIHTHFLTAVTAADVSCGIKSNLYTADSSLLGHFSVTMGQQLWTVQPSNIRNYSPNERVSHPRKFVSSAVALCKPQT
jgi:hypothetical protein